MDHTCASTICPAGLLHPAPRKCKVHVARAASERSVVILPGLGNNAADYEELQSLLQLNHSLHVEVVQVSRLDWFRNAKGLLDRSYWSGSLKPRPTVDWYLLLTLQAVQAAAAAAPDAPITILAHSAGGWLGRLFMKDFGTSTLGIDRFLSLGSPHLPPPPGVLDQTRGILSYISEETPGSFHNDVKYVTVIGKYMQGIELNEKGPWRSKFVGAGYKQVCGFSNVWGDGIIPECSAHLADAEQITLENVYHSPLGAQAESRQWYGSPDIVDSWAGLLYTSNATLL